MQHWSNRATDRRESLWGGFAVFDKQHRFYFAGDTAYCPVFKQIGQKFGPFDLSAIPIGAYEPRDIMIAQHCNPEEAVNIHKVCASPSSFNDISCKMQSSHTCQVSKSAFGLVSSCSRQSTSDFASAQHRRTFSSSANPFQLLQRSE